jgi:uncharacterized protein (DUF2147 family)
MTWMNEPIECRISITDFAAVLLFFMLMCVLTPIFASTSYEGDWMAPGESTDRPGPVITLLRTEQGYRAVIKSMPSVAGADDNPLCNACSTPRKGQPIKGMEIIWGLKLKGDRLVDGYIQPPEANSPMRCQIELSKNQNTLLLRIYMGAPMMGQTLELVRR